MAKVEIVNTGNGEVIVLDGVLYVAPDGTMFVKQDSVVVWAANAPIFMARTYNDI